jgi:DeoR/GlpR family transcriptional regulator of sugar metabolism
MFAEERRKVIFTMLTQAGRVEVPALARRLKVSEDTIRRDLRDLAASGFLQKTHGGAVALDVPNLGWDARAHMQPAAKTRIGATAAPLVEPRQTVILDAGLTVLELARHITARPLRVITNSLDVAGVLADQPQVTLILTGGDWVARDRYLSGEQAVRALGAYRADWAFIGACAVHPQAGMTSREPDDAAVKRAMIASALRPVLLADHSKFGQLATHHVAPVSALHAVVSDEPVDWVGRAGVQVLLPR